MREIKVVMQLPLTVSVWWPEEIPIDKEILKSIAVGAASQSFETALPTKVIPTWLKVYTESSDDEVEFLEGAE